MKGSVKMFNPVTCSTHRCITCVANDNCLLLNNKDSSYNVSYYKDYAINNGIGMSKQELENKMEEFRKNHF